MKNVSEIIITQVYLCAKAFFSGKSFQQEQNFAHILMSFGEIIRLTAANFLVFFALPWLIKGCGSK